MTIALVAAPNMSPLLRSARPRQWLKNVLVFAAPLAAGVLTEPDQLLRTVLAVVAFCFAASGTYLWNDVMDVDADRAHPTKSRRPIAAGEMSSTSGRIWGTAFLVLSLLVAATTGEWRTVVVVALYLVITLTYSAFWKHLAVIDLIAIASGFVLRAAAGATAVDVPMSSWFVLVLTFGSLFLVSGKRFAESRELGDGAAVVRTTLAEYDPSFLRFVMAVTCGGALVSYCMWAFEAKDVSNSQLPFYELSVVPMLAAFLRYALVLEQGHGAAPEDVFTSDRLLQLLGAMWVIVFGAAVYM